MGERWKSLIFVFFNLDVKQRMSYIETFASILIWFQGYISSIKT